MFPTQEGKEVARRGQSEGESRRLGLKKTENVDVVDTRKKQLKDIRGKRGCIDTYIYIYITKERDRGS